MTTRIDSRFGELKAEGRPALVTYFMGGDPDYETSLTIMKALPRPAPTSSSSACRFPIRWPTARRSRLAGLRALKAGQTLVKTLELARRLPRDGQRHADRADGLLQSDLHLWRRPLPRRCASHAGIDGLIVVDLPPEMDEELCIPALQGGHQLHPPGHADHRRQAPAEGAAEHLRLRLLCLDDRHHRLGARRHGQGRSAVKRIKGHTDLPVCVGFGVKTAEQARAIGASADGVVVGTAIVNAGRQCARPEGRRDRRSGRGRRDAGQRPGAGRPLGAPCCRRIVSPSCSRTGDFCP